MSSDQAIAFAVFAFVLSVTPGPNNTMMMASGANFGFRRTIPHMLGVLIGFAFLVLCVSAGLGALFITFPVLRTLLWAGGTLFLLYLAWKIAGSAAIGGAGANRPLRFWEVVAFQWINPKAWIGAISAISAYAPREDYVLGVAVINLLFAVVNTPVVLMWTSAGAFLRPFLEKPLALRIFNIVMAIALVTSLIPPAVSQISALRG